MGNCLFENDTTTHQPADFYEKYGLSYDAQVGEGMDCRSKNGTVGLGVNPNVWRSVVACWSMENGEIGPIALHPITLHQELPRYRRGLPALTDDETVLHELEALCESFRTELKILNGVGYV